MMSFRGILLIYLGLTCLAFSAVRCNVEDSNRPHHPLVTSGNESHSLHTRGHEQHHRVHLASWKWEEYRIIIIFSVMIILGALFKILFHLSIFDKLHMPESCLLILTGIALGYFGHYVVTKTFPEFTIDLFFKVLLPPIILDSAYSLYDRDFFSNLGSIVLFAVVGTIFNTFVIGLILAGSSIGGAFDTKIGVVDCLLFSSLISAVDPVAVLAIFEEIGVNLELYFIVFGESLLNDGVTVVLYNTLKILSQLEHVESIQYVMAVLSFFTVVLGGFLIGWLVGLFSAFSLKYTKETRVIEPIIVITTAYLSYILAETVHWSGIISLIACGICQKRYAFVNISKKSYSTVKYGVKTLSAASDSIIFLFLGQVLAASTNPLYKKIQWNFDVGFVMETLLLCFVVRYISVYGLSYLVNRTRIKKISLREQFIVAYGGLRGAVGFSLAILIPTNNSHRDMFITTTLCVIFFTVFLQGGTIKLLVNKLGIAKKTDEDSLISTELNLQMIDHAISGIESISSGMSSHRFLDVLARFDDKFFKKYLVRQGAFNKLTVKLEKITLDEHFARLYGPTVLYSQPNNDDCVHEIINGGKAEEEEEESHSSDTNNVVHPERPVLQTQNSNNRDNNVYDHHNLLKGIRANEFHQYRKRASDHQSEMHCVAEQLRRKSLTARRISVCLEQPPTLMFDHIEEGLEEDEEEFIDEKKDKFPKDISYNRRHSAASISQRRKYDRRLSLASGTLPSANSKGGRRASIDPETMKNLFNETKSRTKKN